MKSLVVKIEDEYRELCERARSILRERIASRCDVRVVEGSIEAAIILTVDSTLPNEGFRIDDVSRAVRISGGTPLALLYGIGKFLRTSEYDNEFRPSSWRGVSTPQCEIRGVYFATHFHNWYQVAPENEMARYIEDIALWGTNTIMAIFPFINLKGWDDAEAEASIAMLRRISAAARSLGIKVATIVSNVMFAGTPPALAAVPLKDPMERRGNHGNPVCPSNPEGRAYIVENVGRLFERLADVGLDYLAMWPYDEGGCGCDKCQPWGSNGYYSLSREFAHLGKRHFPGLKSILSTWMFDTPPEGEWKGLNEKLKQGNDWLDFILADAHEDFPSYPLNHEAPGQLPLLNFPEISMWGLDPWGGFGATPLPRRFERLWNQAKHKLQGGFPYSEGIFEDINKVLVLQFYWDRDRTAEDILREYIGYEYAPSATDEVLKIISILETTHAQAHRAKLLGQLKTQPTTPAVRNEWNRVIALIESDLESINASVEVDLVAAGAAGNLAKQADAKLPRRMAKEWRWRILYLRAILEPLRLTSDGLKTKEAQTALRELIEIFHCRLEDDGSDPYHSRLRPVL